MLQQNAVEPATLELLKKICLVPSCTAFGLGGGTNLALRLGHRLSKDLDFFSNYEFNNALLFKAITTEFPKSELLFEQNQTMMFNINGIKVDFILYPFEWLQSFEIIESARLISVPDMIPMKLQALSNRFSKKDFWDIAFLSDSFSLEEMIAIFKTKFPQIDTGFIIHSLTAFDEAENEQDPVCLNPKSWEEIKHDLEKAVINYTNQFL
jgi:hypothetical protein